MLSHITHSQQFDRPLLEKLFAVARDMEHATGSGVLQNKVMASLFYEPSTRTRFSFESAMYKLGGAVITTENAREFSSVQKGETLEDTIRIVNHYADVIILRHFEQGAAERAAKVSRVPVINAGDGVGQHPTQALLDIYTIARESGGIDQRRVAMVGDLKNGRTVRSLCYLLGKFEGLVIDLVSPRDLAIGRDITEYLTRHGIQWRETEHLEEVLAQADVIYQTRIQKERFFDVAEYERFNGIYRISTDIVKLMKKSAIIMHPLPRVNEIDVAVDDLPQAAYFKQAGYGLYIRMALLAMVLNKK